MKLVEANFDSRLIINLNKERTSETTRRGCTPHKGGNQACRRWSLSLVIFSPPGQYTKTSISHHSPFPPLPERPTCPAHQDSVSSSSKVCTASPPQNKTKCNSTSRGLSSPLHSTEHGQFSQSVSRGPVSSQFEHGPHWTVRVTDPSSSQL
jgi:hypothetical protein